MSNNLSYSRTGTALAGDLFVDGGVLELYFLTDSGIYILKMSPKFPKSERHIAIRDTRSVVAAAPALLYAPRTIPCGHSAMRDESTGTVTSVLPMQVPPFC